MLVEDVFFDNETILEKFKCESKDIDSKVSNFVYNKIKDYPYNVDAE